MPSLRTPAGRDRYLEHLKTRVQDNSCPLCNQKAIKDFLHWKLTVNEFPYDKIAKVHHMLMPIRHASEQELNAAELNEFKHIKETILNSNYDCIIESTKRSLSIPEHFHLHLIEIMKVS